MRLLLRADRGGRLHYAPLQGRTASTILDRHPGANRALSTVIYVRDAGTSGERLYERSDAAAAILRDLGGLWRLASWPRVVPRPIRDAVYSFIANHRYSWFGTLDACQLPGPGQSERFLD